MTLADKTPDYVAVTYIAATPEAIWSALTNPRVASAFFGAPVEIGTETGGPFIVRHGEHPLVGRILAFEAPRRLHVLWAFPSDPPPDEVEFLIDPAGKGVTRLMLREYHGRAWAKAIVESGIYGWGVMLSAIKTFAETGKLLPTIDLKGPQP